MGKFAISCPGCGSYVTAYNGLRGLIQNKITCANCNCTMDVKNNRMTNIVCPSCGNTVMYDQGKAVPKCPVCKSEIAPATGQKMIKIHCPTCHAAYSMTAGTSKFLCPLCDSHIDVRKEVAAIGINEGGTSLIEYVPGDKDWLAYKHPIQNFANGSKLIVRPGQQALLIEAGEDSHLFDKGEYIMDTANYPWMEKAYRLSDGDTKGSFQSTIYFFNTRIITNDGKGNPLEWFVRKTPVEFEMHFEGTDRPTRAIFNIGCGGTYDICIKDARKFYLNLNSVAPGMNVTDIADEDVEEKQSGRKFSSAAGSLAHAIKRKINGWGAEILSSSLKQSKVGIFELSAKRSMLSEAIENCINAYLDNFGLQISSMLIDSFAMPEDDPDDPGYNAFIKMRNMSADAAVRQQAEIHNQDIEQQVQITQRAKIQTAKEAIGFDDVEAQRKVIAATAEAKSKELQYAAEAAGLKMKGGNYQMQTIHDVGMAAMKNGLVSANGSSSGLGELASMGISLGAMGSIIGMTKEAIAPAIGGTAQFSQAAGAVMQNDTAAAAGWDCLSCGARGNQLKFCPVCGAEQPRPMNGNTWDCPVCGMKGNRMKFCPGCGAEQPKPVAEDTWDCPVCGTKGNRMKFCPSCGAARPKPVAEDTWDCPVCGTKGNRMKFCPGCGAAQPKPVAEDTWDCPVCGAKGNRMKFCPGCGAAQPKPVVDDTWDCPACGSRENKQDFCPGCGTKRPVLIEGGNDNEER